MKVLRTLIFLILLYFPLSSFGEAPAFDKQYGSYNAMLKANVQNGMVDYGALKKQPEQLSEILSQFSFIDASVYETWNNSEKIAYLTNAYNFFTLKLIADHFPVDSIKDIGSKLRGAFFWQLDKQWKVSEYAVNNSKVQFRALGRLVTLDEIEHQLLRKLFDEPRIHFALVCGARSCPPLRSEAYVGDRLDEQLESQASLFLNDREKNFYDLKSDTLELSKIFDWFSSDFGGKEGVKNIVTKYLSKTMKEKISKDTKIKYLPYDWNLNKKL